MKKEFSLEFAKKTEECEQIVRAALPEEEGAQRTVLEAINYSVRAGGKRLRPLLMLESYLLFSPSEARDRSLRPILHAFMSAMEMIHTFSLCHDDLPCMDGDLYRRGQKSTWHRFGEAMGTLAGDGLSLYAFEWVSGRYAERRSMDPELMSYTEEILRGIYLLSRSAGISGMLGGQAVDVEMTGLPLSEEQLLFIYEKKTAALISASMEIGALLGGAEPSEAAAIRSVGEKVGIAFQIQDDILDETSTEELLGKPVHSDEENEKSTYVRLFGLEKAAREVARLSEEAGAALSGLQRDGISEEESFFLQELIRSLIYRKK